MQACDDCGHIVHEGEKTICDVDAESLDEDTLALFNEHWQTDGEGCDCPCSIDRAT